MLFGLGWVKIRNVYHWSVPFCAFFSTFTIVMTILVISTDFNKSHHFVHFNYSNVWDFEDLYQDNNDLISVIRENYLIPPKNVILKNKSNMHVPGLLFTLVKRKRQGVFVECGAGSRGAASGAEALEAKLGWGGIATQPHAADFLALQALGRPRSVLARVCISPITTPKHAEFRASSLGNNSETGVVPCFPLYSLLLAMNYSTVDLLVLNVLSAELQIMKTLPAERVRVGLLVVIQERNGLGPCCREEFLHFLHEAGFRQATSCPTVLDRCYFPCAAPRCPR